MNPDLELPWEEIENLVNMLVFKHTVRYLTDIEIDVLRGAWEGKSYEEIAEQLFRSVSYINKDVGYRLQGYFILKSSLSVSRPKEHSRARLGHIVE